MFKRDDHSCGWWDYPFDRVWAFHGRLAPGLWNFAPYRRGSMGDGVCPVQRVSPVQTRQPRDVAWGVSVYLLLGIFTPRAWPHRRTGLPDSLPLVSVLWKARSWIEVKGSIAHFSSLCSGFYGLVYGQERIGERPGGQPF